MALTPYKKLLTMTKEAVQSSMAVVRAREMRKRAEMEQAQLESKIVEKEAEIEKLATEYPISFTKLIGAMDDKALLQRQCEQFSEIIAELFPEE